MGVCTCKSIKGINDVSMGWALKAMYLEYSDVTLQIFFIEKSYSFVSTAPIQAHASPWSQTTNKPPVVWSYSHIFY